MKKKGLLSVLAGILLAGAVLLSACGETTGNNTAGGSSAASSTSTVSEDKPAVEAADIGEQGQDVTIGEENTEVEPVDVRIAFCCWGFADEDAMSYQRQLQTMGKGFMTLEQPINVQWEWITCISPEEQLTALEAIHEKGIDGVIILWMTEATVDALTNWEIPFVSYNDFSDELETYAEASPYYLGTLDNRTDLLGEAQMRYAIETLGCKEILAMGPAPGMPNHDDRFVGYEKVLAEHPEVQLYEVRNDDPRQDSIPSLLYMHPNIDCIVDTGATGGYGDTVVQALRVAGYGKGEVKYVTYGFIEDQVNAMNDGIIAYTQQGGTASICHLFVELMNTVMGTPINEKATLLTFPQITITSVEDFQNFKKYCTGKVPMYTFEEYKPYFKWINPDVTAEEFNHMCDGLSLEDVMERHAEYFE